VLEVVDIDTFYGQSQILWGISFKVEAGQTVALPGRNGMGKIMTVRSIMGRLKGYIVNQESIVTDSGVKCGIMSYIQNLL